MATPRDPLTGRFVSQDMARLIQSRTNYLTAISVAGIVEAAAKQTEAEVGKYMAKYAKDISAKSKSKAEIARINKQVGEGARRAVKKAYREARIGTRKSYRTKDPDRDSGEKMQKAFNTPGFITYDANGIKFADKEILTRNARQWARLNFGTQPRGSVRPPEPLQMKFPSALGGATIAGARIQGGVRRAFAAPDGNARAVWSSTAIQGVTGDLRTNRGLNMYIARRGLTVNGMRPHSTPPVMTKGIQGKRFLDAGTAYMNAEYPKKLAKHFSRLFG